MPAKRAGGSDLSISKQISELQKKLQLLEGDRKAYYESSKSALQQNKEKIAELRAENKELHLKFAGKQSNDSKVIDEAFKERSESEKGPYKRLTATEAIKTMDSKCLDLQKRLNRMQGQRSVKDDHLNQRKAVLNQLGTDEQAIKDTDTGKSKDGQKKRQLENKLEKADMKADEAEKLNRTYSKIKNQLVHDELGSQDLMDNIEVEIKDLEEELKRLSQMNTDANQTRDLAKSEFQSQEIRHYEAKREREQQLQRLKTEVEEKKIQERNERRMQRASMGAVDDDQGNENPIYSANVQTENKIKSYEEAFSKIKEKTGVYDTQEIVLRFENQESTGIHLEEVKIDNRKMIGQLKDNRETLELEYEDLKYTGEAKLSSGQKIVEEFEAHYMKESERETVAERTLEENIDVLVDVKAGVDHLHHKLKHLKETKGDQPPSHAPKDSDEHVLDLIMICEDKLLKLTEDLDDENIDEVKRKMDEDDIVSAMEGSQPRYNVRIKFDERRKDMHYDEDEESADDDDVPSRIDIKRQAQSLVDSKTKRKTTKRKKKKQ